MIVVAGSPVVLVAGIGPEGDVGTAPPQETSITTQQAAAILFIGLLPIPTALGGVLSQSSANPLPSTRATRPSHGVPRTLGNAGPPELLVRGMDLEFVYVGDPMCSWCWGFAPVLDRMQKVYDVPLRVVVGAALLVS